MAKLGYSDYPFFDKKNTTYTPLNSTNHNGNNKRETVIEGIANFCALNRSQAGMNTTGWTDLSNAINTEDETTENKYNIGLTNNNLKKFAGKVGDVIESSGNLVNFGNVHVFTNGFDEYINKIPVTKNGIFEVIDNIIKGSPNKYSFAYEDSDKKLRRVVINDGFDNLTNKEGFDTYNRIFGLVITDDDITGRISIPSTTRTGLRRTNGKLENTEQRNSGAEKRYNGMKSIYNETFSSTVNLSLGIMVAFIFIAKSQ
jgi:hypothetical protein